ncbi:MAG TPA: hypothetical protein VMR66_09325 [Gemmatimonadota bacterium]|nr:hypothetical protein [Gemmatimonadota bacterium]
MLLRVAPMALRAVLAVLVGWLVLRHRRGLPAVVTKCWMIILLAVAFAAVNGVWLEALGVGLSDLPPDAPRRRFYYPVYSAGYLINASLAAMLPAALLALLLMRTKAGWAALGTLYLALAIALSGILRGSHDDWEVLLSTTPSLQLLGLAGWTAFFVAYFLGFLPRVDGYLAAFLGVAAIFVMLTPINEAVLLLVGRENAAAVWNTLLVMQSVRYLLQIGIVALLIRTLQGGGAVGRALARPASGTV